MKILKDNFLLLVLFALSIFAVLPLFNSGFFNIHDDTQVQRVFEMKTALQDGMFPVRWVPDLGYGYGYPIFNFYGPLPYYVGAFISMFGLNVLLATKIMILIGVFGAGFTMYILAKEFWGKFGGLLSALLYLYAPYHGLNTYVRGDIGEVYSYFFIPLIFYGTWKHYKTQKFVFLIIGSVGYAGVIASHNLSGLMITPFVLLATFLLVIKRRNLLLFFIPVVGILLSAFYSLPAFLEMNYTNVMSTIGGKADFRDHFVCLRQLWDSPWMYGGSASGCVDGLSFRLGKLHILFGAAALFSIVLFKKEKEKPFVLLASLSGLLISIFLMLSVSGPIWEAVPYMNFFQYPWRFLLIASFFSSFAAGSLVYILSKFQKKGNKWVLFGIYSLLIISPLILYSKLFVPQQYLNKTSEDYTNEMSLKWTTSKISDEYMPKSFKKPISASGIIRNKISSDDVQISNLVSKTNRLSAQLFATEEGEVTLHLPYFPAWTYYINGEKTKFNPTNIGVIVIVPKGESRLDARFEQTAIEKIANLLSVSGVLIIIAGIIYAKQKNHE